MSDGKRPSVFSTLISFVSLLVQLGILIILALLLAEVKKMHSRDSDPIRVAITGSKSSTLDVRVANLASDAVPIQFTGTPKVSVTNSITSPLYVEAS